MVSDSEAIRAGLKMNMPALAAQLAPGGYIQNGEYWPCNPARQDRKPGSFCIQLYGENAGYFHDFASPDMNGDAIDFIALLVFGLVKPDGRRDPEVWRWARRYLSLPEQERLPPKEFAARQSYNDPRPDEVEKEQSAFRWWLKAGKLEPGTVGWDYLTRARSLPLDQLAHHPGAIRFVPSLRYNGGGDYQGSRWPGLLTCMTDGEGKIRAVHRTYLQNDGSGKAPVDKPRMVWPSTKGLSIRISRGRSKRTPEECKRRGEREDRQILIEGIEKGIAAALIYPDARVTVTGSFDLMRSSPIFDCAREILIIADNDETYRDGRLDRMALDIKARAEGREVLVTRALTAKDTDDLFRKGAV